jgi:hypothetical protein
MTCVCIHMCECVHVGVCGRICVCMWVCRCMYASVYMYVAGYVHTFRTMPFISFPHFDLSKFFYTFKSQTMIRPFHNTVSAEELASLPHVHTHMARTHIKDSLFIKFFTASRKSNLLGQHWTICNCFNRWMLCKPKKAHKISTQGKNNYTL